MSTLQERLGGSKNVIGGPFGSKLTQKDYADEGVPVIRGSNMDSSGRWLGGDYVYVSEEKVEADLGTNIARPGDIIVTQRGTLGQVAIVPDSNRFDRYVISQSQMAVRVPSGNANRDFVYYFLQSPQFAAYVETCTIQTGVPHINLGILRDGSGGLSGFHDEALTDGPAVIVGRKGTVGSLYWEDRPVFPIDTVFYVVPKRGTLLFCYQLLLTQPLADMNTDAAVPGLNRGNAYRLEVAWPGPELTHAFETIVAPLWKRRSANLRQTETLVQTRDLLLPKLMSGEIRLRDAEKAVEAAA